MEKKSLTIQEALRFSNHDLLNHLNLIQMNLDLNRVDEAKQIIHDIANVSKTFSITNKLGLEKTALWFQMFPWYYGAIALKVECNGDSLVAKSWDCAIEQYLEKTIIHVYDHLDPFEEQNLIIKIHSTAGKLTVNVHLTGKWDDVSMEKENANEHVIWHECSNRSWHFEISLKE